MKNFYCIFEFVLLMLIVDVDKGVERKPKTHNTQLRLHNVWLEEAEISSLLFSRNNEPDTRHVTYACMYVQGHS
jgi:hypothetical protein